ncbi:tryptophan-rich sensory protein [Candidatus Microgenomates bacterium]|nr:tryptophan-rich sensory protein [Candidatus Microgenomates bacterium]
MPIKIPKLILSIGLCLGVGVLGGIFTTSAPPAGGLTWYASLNKPIFSPPNFVFAPVWTILYILMGISLYLVWKKKAVPVIFWVQLFLNFLWSLIFFGWHNPILALVDIVALWISIFLTIKAFNRVNKLAGNLLIPYLVWVSFASVLNLAIALAN